MGDGNAFGFEPEDFERAAREARDGLREAFGWLGHVFAGQDEVSWAGVLENLARRSRPAPATTGEAGDGVWAVYTVGEGGDARVEQVYPTEIEALRANRHNTDPRRKVRFLPYGIAVGVLDDPDDPGDPGDDPGGGPR